MATLLFTQLRELRRIPRLRRRNIFSVLRLFKEVNQVSERFQGAIGMSCLSGCGQCCENPHIEATVLEMLPLAFDYYLREGTDWPNQGLVDQQSVCRFYVADEKVSGKGRCSQYELRPMLCRLFGFSTRLNKYGREEFMTCRPLKENFPQACSRAQDIVASGVEAPFMNEFSLKLDAIEPSLSREKMPISLAFEKAVGLIGLWMNYSY